MSNETHLFDPVTLLDPGAEPILAQLHHVQF